jgi:hypothetical protein
VFCGIQFFSNFPASAQSLGRWFESSLGSQLSQRSVFMQEESTISDHLRDHDVAIEPMYAPIPKLNLAGLYQVIYRP